MTLPERIIFILKETGLTQEAFGEKIGASQSAVQKWVAGKSTPNSRFLMEITAKFKQFNRTWVLTGEGDPYGSAQEDRVRVRDELKIVASRPVDYGNNAVETTPQERALIRTLRICGPEYTKRVYVAASVRAQRVIEESNLDNGEKAKARKDLETLTIASIE